jgi:hypothetical protein
LKREKGWKMDHEQFEKVMQKAIDWTAVAVVIFVLIAAAHGLAVRYG